MIVTSSLVTAKSFESDWLSTSFKSVPGFSSVILFPGDREAGGGTNLYGLYREVPLDRVWFRPLSS